MILVTALLRCEIDGCRAISKVVNLELKNCREGIDVCIEQSELGEWTARWDNVPGVPRLFCPEHSK